MDTVYIMTYEVVADCFFLANVLEFKICLVVWKVMDKGKHDRESCLLDKCTKCNFLFCLETQIYVALWCGIFLLLGVLS